MTSKEDLKELKNAFLTIKQEWLEDSNVKLTEWQEYVFESLEKDLEVLKILRPFLKEVLEINENGTIVHFKSVKYYNGYVVDINGDWNETEQIKKNKKIKGWLENDKI